MGCFQPLEKHVSVNKIESRLVFSPTQVDTFRKIAHETRLGGGPRGMGKLGRVSAGNLVWFSGPSGTGKTLAAEVIARELGTRPVRVNFKKMVNQYIGETEKSLAQVFAMAQKKGAVLLFDEADVLFGKRNAVNNSYDRYANQEVSYLLDKIASYHGLVILSSNRKADIESNIRCRVKYLFEFALPAPPSRLQPSS